MKSSEAVTRMCSTKEVFSKISQNSQKNTNVRGSGLSPQNCLYFQGFRGSKLVNGCLVVSPSKPCLRRIQCSNFQDSKFISDFKIFQ